MLKKISLLCVILFTLICLSSCVKESYDFDITATGGSVSHEQIITKEVYDMLVSMGANPSENKESGGELSFYTEDGTEYVKITMFEEFDSLDELNLYLREMGAQAEETSETDISDRFFDTIQVKIDETGKILSITGRVAKQNDVSPYTSCDIVFNFTGEIISSDIGEKIDNQTIKINMLELWESSSSATFLIESKVPSHSFSLLVIGIVFAAMLIAVCIIVFVICKKKRPVLNEPLPESSDSENT